MTFFDKQTVIDALVINLGELVRCRNNDAAFSRVVDKLEIDIASFRAATRTYRILVDPMEKDLDEEVDDEL